MYMLAVCQETEDKRKAGLQRAVLFWLLRFVTDCISIRQMFTDHVSVCSYYCVSSVYMVPECVCIDFESMKVLSLMWKLWEILLEDPPCIVHILYFILTLSLLKCHCETFVVTTVLACLCWPCVHYSPWRTLAKWWFYWICSPWTTHTYLLFFTWGG